MASIDDIGDVNSPLGLPALGGPDGWAAAVRDKLNDLAAAITGKVSKAGDTMTGELVLSPNGAITAAKDGDNGARFSLANVAGAGAAFTLIGGRLVLRQLIAGSGIGSSPVTLEVAHPQLANDASTKAYADGIFAGGQNGVADVIGAGTRMVFRTGYFGIGSDSEAHYIPYGYTFENPPIFIASMLGYTPAGEGRSIATGTPESGGCLVYPRRNNTAAGTTGSAVLWLAYGMPYG